MMTVRGQFGFLPDRGDKPRPVAPYVNLFLSAHPEVLSNAAAVSSPGHEDLSQEISESLKEPEPPQPLCPPGGRIISVRERIDRPWREATRRRLSVARLARATVCHP